MAIEFGFATELIMGSRSYYGPVTGKKRLKDGDLLYQSKNQICSSEVPKIQSTVESCGLSKAFDLSHLGKLIDFSISKTIVLTASPGPEYNTLKDSIKKSLNQEFTLGANDRMGYLLIERIQNDCPAIYSSAVLPGTVQLTPSGQLIILANDGQVTGGYPRVLHISDQSMCQLSQLISGEKIRFKILSIN
jgi:allophanate hydrolase subunit 2